RHLLHDAVSGERRARGPYFPGPRRGRRGRAAPGRAALLRDRQAVPARSLRQGRVPEVRRQGSVWRRLRGLREHLRADRSEESLLRALQGSWQGRSSAGAAHLGALLRPALEVPGLLARVDFGSRAFATRGEALDRRLAVGAAQGLGYLPRRALFR